MGRPSRGTDMSVPSFLYKVLVDLLEDHRIVVWYDTEKAFGDFVATFKAPNVKVVSGTCGTARTRGRTGTGSGATTNDG